LKKAAWMAHFFRKKEELNGGNEFFSEVVHTVCWTYQKRSDKIQSLKKTGRLL
jgi:hypothetical protein